MEITSTNQARNLLIAGGVLLFFSLYLLAFLLPDFIRSLAGSESITMETAAERATSESIYVAVEDGKWRCETIHQAVEYSSTESDRKTIRTTEVFLTNESGSVALLAKMSGEMDCDELEATDLSGYLTRMSADTQQDLTNDARLARFFDATDFLEICGYCGQTNSLIGTLFGFAFAIGGLALIVLGIRARG